MHATDIFKTFLVSGVCICVYSSSFALAQNDPGPTDPTMQTPEDSNPDHIGSDANLQSNDMDVPTAQTPSTVQEEHRDNNESADVARTEAGTASASSDASSTPADPETGVPGLSKENKKVLESLKEIFPVNGNPLKDLFTPQPQYITPQTLMNPQPAAPLSGESNPLKGLFTAQPQYPTPQTLMNPHPTPDAADPNHLKGVFTAQPQFPTPQTLMNSHPMPRYYVKERLPNEFFEPIAASSKSIKDKNPTNQNTAAAAAAAAQVAREHGDMAAATSNALRQAVQLINAAHETDAIGLLERVMVQSPNNYQAHYLKAVALVRMRRYGDARTVYKTILQSSADMALKRLAEEGLAKLGTQGR